MTVGTQIGKLTFDFGTIKTKYKFYSNPTNITIFSTSYNYKSFLFNLSSRKEQSDNWAFENGTLVLKRKKSDTYGGIQYSINRSLVVGLHYNYFLLHELAGSLTIYF